MSRLFRRLGFADFHEVKEHTRALRSSGVPLATGDADGARPTHAALEQRNLLRLLESPWAVKSALFWNGKEAVKKFIVFASQGSSLA